MTGPRIQLYSQPDLTLFCGYSLANLCIHLKPGQFNVRYKENLVMYSLIGIRGLLSVSISWAFLILSRNFPLKKLITNISLDLTFYFYYIS